MVVSKVAGSQDALHDQYNALVDEISDPDTGHNHDGVTGGQQISHTDLLDGAITGTTNSHAQLDAHVSGSENVHGLADGVYVAGGQAAGLFIQAGNDTFGTSDSWKTITFPIEFTTIITVVITMQVEDEGAENGCAVANFTTTGFDVWVHQYGESSFSWIAVGTK
jgi:hypothetical protein